MKHCLIAILFGFSCGLSAADVVNLVPNGSFEEDMRFWSFEEYKGLSVPGRIEETNAQDGKKYFVFTTPGNMNGRFVRTGDIKIDPSRNYTVKFMLSGTDVPDGAVKVHLLQAALDADGKRKVLGWLRVGQQEELTGGQAQGTFDWKEFSVRVPSSAFRPECRTVAFYFLNDKPATGELAIDAVGLFEE